MHEYTLVHMLCKLLLSPEALLKFLEKPLGQAGIHLGDHTQGGFELGRAEKFTQLEEKVKETHQQSWTELLIKIFSFAISSFIGSLSFIVTPSPLTFSLGEESTSSGAKRDK